ncbi:MAG: hypothetical protein ABS76_35630 [Pelagibacterium sp. SCN 64-44]|nr:MAG: hypothetical protein ABS76_35630 [Pelagibacterium sp. SCN 64-44]
MVIISHAFLVLRPGEDVEPLSWAAYDLGATAVNMFFVLSGVMVSRSYDRNPDIRRFVIARLLRIYPGLVVAAIVTTVVIGPLSTELPPMVYFADVATWTYHLRVLYDFAGATIPTIFTGNIDPGTNESLWTIKYELLAYGCFVALVWLGLLRRQWTVEIICVSAGVLLVTPLGVVEDGAGAGIHLVRFVFAFSAGMLAYRHAARLRLSLPVAVIGVAAALIMGQAPGATAVSILAFGYAALVLGSVEALVPAYFRRHDFSYGLYLYGWPVQQGISHHIAWDGFWIFGHIALALVISGGLAAASWFWIERQALALKR